MPVPDTSGIPPFADFDMMKTKINEIVQKFNNLLVNLDDANFDKITAKVLDVNELSAITANMGKLTSGEIYGAYIATAEGTYPRAEMSSTANYFKAATSANNFVSILPYYNVLNAPMIQITNTAIGSSVDFYINDLNGKITINSANTIRVSRGANYMEWDGVGIKIPDWTTLYNGSTTQTLQAALDAKATKSASTSTDSGGGHNHGFTSSDYIQCYDSAGNPTVKKQWSPYTGYSHSHTQT